MMSAVSGPAESNGGQDGTENGAGVLANLPRPRPQRVSARRTAARRAGSGTQQAPRSGKAGSAKRTTKTTRATGGDSPPATSPKPATKAKAKTGTKSPTTAKRSASAGTARARPAAARPKAAAAKAARPRRTTKPPLAEP